MQIGLERLNDKKKKKHAHPVVLGAKKGLLYI